MKKDLYQNQGVPRFYRKLNIVFQLIIKFGHKLYQKYQCARLLCLFIVYRCIICPMHIVYKASYLKEIQLDYLLLLK
jgi:hypothetical protein